MPKCNTVLFREGDKVFAKMKGYRHWPARIDEVAEGAPRPPKGKYPIFFYGTHEIAYLAARSLCHYENWKHKYAKPTKKPGYMFNEGIWEIENNPDINLRRHSRPVEMIGPITGTEEAEETVEETMDEEQPVENLELQRDMGLADVMKQDFLRIAILQEDKIRLEIESEHLSHTLSQMTEKFQMKDSEFEELKKVHCELAEKFQLKVSKLEELKKAHSELTEIFKTKASEHEDLKNAHIELIKKCERLEGAGVKPPLGQ